VKGVTHAILTSAALMAVAIPARATDLQIYSWFLGGGTANVRIAGSPYSYVGAGPMSGRIDGQGVDRPFYCLDLFNSFHFNDEWEVETYVIPPETPPPPPYNIEQAAWVYNNYGYTSDRIEGIGVQIALWEITHEGHTDGVGDWLAEYVSSSDPDGWHSKGDFKYDAGSDYAASLAHADMILGDLKTALEDPGFHQGRAVMYLKPLGDDPGQGQLVGVPEPSILLILGSGLAGLGALRLRRRRS